MKDFLLNGPEDYKIMSQKGVKQYVFPLESEHNAIWDTTVMPNGDLYFALATELTKMGYVRLCKYDYKSNTVEECFKVEDVIMPSDRAIRASKFHTSIGLMNDGKLIMTTHTTDKSPNHPSWMPINYYHHLWDGFAGGNIVTYDPKTKKAENVGIPVPHETIYGALYEPKHNALYFTGGFRGHTYRYSFDDKKLIDFGQTSENWAFRMLFGKDGHIYSASKSGYIFRINTETLKIEDLNYRAPVSLYPKYPSNYNSVSNGGIGPDGRLYMCFFFNDYVIAYDCDTGEFENMGRYMPEAKNYDKTETRHGIFGMSFDNDGVLWYSVWGRNCNSGIKENGIPASLYRWDIARGGKPEYLGLAGTKERVGCWTSEICVDKDNVLYLIGSNHAMDGPDITAIDLKIFTKDMYNFGSEFTEDEYYMNPDNKRYNDAADFFLEKDHIGNANNWRVSFEPAYQPARIWRKLAPDNIENSNVKVLKWIDNTKIVGVCGNNKEFIFKVENGVIIEIFDKEKDKSLYNSIMSEKKDISAKYTNLPFYPGRQYKAVATAEANLSNGNVLVGTEDGMVALCKSDGVFGFGPAVYNGPIRDMCVTPDGKTVYGVGGDIDDIGIVFKYDEKNGLRWLGHVTYDMPNEWGAVNCPIITSCDITPDGKTLAIGSGDRMGMVMFYQLV